MRVWDVVFTDGWKMLFRVGLARLRAIEPRAAAAQPRGDEPLPAQGRDAGAAGASAGGGGGARAGDAGAGGGVNVDALLEAALAIKVTNKILRQLQEEFGVQLLRERLSGGQGQWLMRYGEASQALLEEHVLDGLRAELGKLDRRRSTTRPRSRRRSSTRRRG